VTRSSVQSAARRRPTRIGRRSASAACAGGFTLIELLVVIAIVGLLLAVSVPAVQSVRESARKTECLDHLHQLGVALQHHDAAYGHLPKDNERGWGVPAFLLPELEQRPLYDQLNPLTISRTSLAPTAQPLLATAISVLACPSFPDSDSPAVNGGGRTTYLGTDGLFTKRLTLSDVIDGESNTLAFGETTGDHAWAWPGLGSCGSGPNRGSFGSFHSGGAQFVFCDGKARLLSDSIDLEVFQALCTPQGGEAVGSY
jgi:prepilin-type N-terminal cleavage/methylation domain-containing protein/prepilin-type processing-associated H-X9-DG protein